MQRTTFGDIQSRIQASIQHAAHLKTAGAQTTGAESQISIPSSDPEVKEMAPGGDPANDKTKDLTATGVASGEKMPGASTPPAEEKNRREVPVSSKVATIIDPSLVAIQERLAANLKIAADISSGGGQSTPAVDGAVNADTQSDTSGAAPVVVGTEGVTQTQPGAPTSPPGGQGPSEAKVAEINLDTLGEKVAHVVQDIQLGRSLAHNLVGYMADMNSPLMQDREKMAAAVRDASITATANAMMKAGIESGVITEKQASDLMKVAGFAENPLVVAICAVEQKIAAINESSLNDNQKIAFLHSVVKVAGPEEAVAAAGGQAPVDPQQMQAELGQLLQELQDAVQSGQMTEEEALGLLEQLGIPIDAPGGDPAAGGAAPGGDPAAAAAAGIPPEAAAAGIPPEAAAAGAPPAGIPPEAAAAAEAAAPAAAAEAEENESSGEKKKESEEKEKKEAAADAAHNRAFFNSKVAAFLTSRSGFGKIASLIKPVGEYRNLKVAEATDPAMVPPPDGGAPAGGAPTSDAELQQLLAELQAMVQSGQMTQEEAEQILAVLQQGGGSADPAAAAAAGGAAAPVA